MYIENASIKIPVTLLFTLLLCLAPCAESYAGRGMPCAKQHPSYIDFSSGTVEVKDILFNGALWNGVFSIGADGAPLQLTSMSSSEDQQAVPGGFVTTNSSVPVLDLHCIYADGVYYWSELGVLSQDPVLMGLNSYGPAYDVSGRQWALQMTNNCQGQPQSSTLSVDDDYGSSLDGTVGQTALYQNWLNVFFPDGGYMSGIIHGQSIEGTYNLKSGSGCFTGELQSTGLPLQNGRFRTEVSWIDHCSGQTDQARSLGNSPEGGFFFFSADDWELLVKVVNGCEINNRFWVFASTASNVEYTLTVTDTQTNEKRTFTASPQPHATITDTSAFATCP